MARISPQTWGRAVTLLGITVSSPDCVLVRFLSEAGVAPMCVVFWRALLVAVMLGLCALVKARGPRRLLPGFRAGPSYVLFGSVMMACAIFLIPLSLTLTSTANSLLLLSLRPLWAALLGRFVLKEHLPWRTITALGLAICSGVVIYMPSILQAVQGSRRTSSAFWGDSASLAAGWAYAFFLIAVRSAAKHAPQTEMGIANSLGAGLAAAMAASIAGGSLQGLGGFDPERPSWQFWLAAVADTCCLGFCSVAISIAPAYITAAEVSLICLMIVVLGPLLMWAVYGDVPPWWTILGGSGLVLTLIGHEVAGMLERPPASDKGCHDMGGEVCAGGHIKGHNDSGGGEDLQQVNFSQGPFVDPSA